MGKGHIVKTALRFICALIGISCISITSGQPGEALRPNIIFILCDDLGIGDLGCYGQEKLKTPNIDSLAETGLLFQNHYSGSTVCAPSRCILMTGQHSGHTYIRGNSPSGDGVTQPEFGQYPIPEDLITIPKLLKQAGYATGMYGKWGLGGPDNSGASTLQGWDDFYGYYCQSRAHSYYVKYIWHNTDKVELDGDTYTHDLIWNKGMDFVKQRAKADSPFFAYFSITVPHATMAAPQELHEKWCSIYPQFNDTIGNYGGRDMGKDRRIRNPVAGFAAMMENLDNQVGALIHELKVLDIYENTLIIFTSDNGAHKEGGHKPDFWNSNGPYQGHKRSLYEGGIHVPLLVSWPSQIRPGTQTDHLSAFWDWLPTFTELAGVPVPVEAEIDGLSMAPLLTQDQARQKTHKFLYWEFTEGVPRKALRSGDWKLILSYAPDGITIKKTELFNLKKDTAESRNLFQGHPEKVQELTAGIQASQTPSDTFPFRGRPPKKK